MAPCLILLFFSSHRGLRIHQCILRRYMPRFSVPAPATLCTWNGVPRAGNHETRPAVILDRGWSPMIDPNPLEILKPVIVGVGQVKVVLYTGFSLCIAFATSYSFFRSNPMS